MNEPFNELFNPYAGEVGRPLRVEEAPDPVPVKRPAEEPAEAPPAPSGPLREPIPA